MRRLEVGLALVVALVVAPVGGCARRDEAPAPSTSASAPPTVPEASSTTVAIPPPPIPELQLLKFRFTSAVSHKEPVDRLEDAVVGERVFAHFTVRNRGGAAQKLHVVFRVAGKDRTTVDLEIAPSWSFRTWAFNTLRKGDEGKLEVVATDETGHVVAAESLPITSRPRGPRRP